MENQLQVIETRTVEFYGDELIAVKVEVDGKETVYVPVKRLCDNLRLGFGSQTQKLRGRRVLSKGVTMIVIPTLGGNQEVLCLRYDLIPTWLMLINPSKVSLELREKLERYQEEAAEVLADVFLRKGYATNPNLNDLERQAALMRVQAELLREQRLTKQVDADLQVKQKALGLLSALQGHVAPSLMFGVLSNMLGVPVAMVPHPSAKQLSVEFAPILGFEVPPTTLGKIARAAGLFVGIDRKVGLLENAYIIMSTTVAIRSKRMVPQALYKPLGAQKLLEACQVALSARKIEPTGQMHLEGVN